MDKDINKIIKNLRLQHPDAVCELNFNTPFELLVAVILSAQCTDKRVNLISKELFKKFNTPRQFAEMSSEELIPYIRSCGYYNSKSRAIIESSREILSRFGGEVPSDINDLMSLRGVGRKTANVVSSVAFNGDNIAVDTHVQRVSNRIGIAHSNRVEITEKQLMENIPKENWSEFHHLLIHHGRYICNARRPKCEECLLVDECDYYLKNLGVLSENENV